jgi:hypothetical protein
VLQPAVSQNGHGKHPSMLQDSMVSFKQAFLCALGLACTVVLGSAQTGGKHVLTSPLQHAAALRRTAASCTAGPGASDHLTRTALWLESAEIVSSWGADGAIVDCVPYLQQPGLLWASPEEQKAALLILNNKYKSSRTNNLRALSKCPHDTVAVVRTRPGVCIPGKKAPPRASHQRALRAARDPALSYNSNINDYDWVTNPWGNVSSAVDTYGIFSVGHQAALPVCTNDGQCHSLNQIWWLTTEGSAKNEFTQSLEAGWITSNYFTQDVTTSVFVFSTNDSYRGNPTDYYNLPGGFIMAPSSPITLGLPVSQLQWTLSYRKDPGAFILWAQRFEEGPDAGSFSVVDSTWYAVGHYPYSRFSSDANFDWFQCGAEVYHQDNVASASGRILGCGSSQVADRYGEFQFTPIPTFVGFSASYFPTTWTPPNGFAAEEGVQFQGSPVCPS